MPTGPFSDFEIARLRDLWESGKSTKKIGVEMDRKKNSIIGKAHRLCLPARSSPIPTVGSGARRPYAQRRYVTGTVTLSALPSLSTPLPAIPKLRIRSVRLKRKASAKVITIKEKRITNPPFYSCGCYWPIGKNGKYTLYCDAEITRGAFCTEHANQAYIRPRDRRENAATKETIRLAA